MIELITTLTISAAMIAFLVFRLFKTSNNLKKYDGIISVENEIAKLTEDLDELKNQGAELNFKYQIANSIYKDLEEDISLYRNELEFMDFGLYEPVFDYETSDRFKEEIQLIRTKQKELIKNGQACVCRTEWFVGNSKKQGEIMTRRYINLSLRAFNGECDSLINKVKWNNVERFQERINRAFDAINKLGKSINTFLTNEYLRLKIDELHLVHEFELTKQEEKESQRAFREEQREEEKAIREYEKARKEAEEEEERFRKALERAQKELGLVSGEELDKLNSQIAELESSLKQANEAKERAISRAQETKSGHVYVISNIGSFGEGIYKIGMTRRLEPLDRVRELGDASVPFRFDLHALIFTKNAPELENLLQKEFDDRRVNKVNYRKEYFKVTLDEIENIIKERYDKEVEFMRIPEAQEFRETKIIESKVNGLEEKEISEKYPESIF